MLRIETKNFKGVRSSDGLISLDFLFGFLLSFAFLMVFFALAYSLTIVEVVQYVAFASSRTYMGADISESAQEISANAKAKSLVKKKFSSFLNADWFQVGSGQTIVKILKNDMSFNTEPNPQPNFNIGVQISLTIHLLDFRVPFFGRTKTTDAGDGFKTMISSYLIREPTQDECLKFNDARGTLLKALPPYSNLTSFSPGSVMRITDNGC